MSCDTLNSQSTRLNVSLGSLPEGFCPSSMQELGNALAQRLIVTPSEGFNGIAVGSTEPASNVGPWLKNCLEWFFFDDATSSYKKQAKGGFDSQQIFETSSTFTVPEGITKIFAEAWGGGGGGTNDSGGGGGGSGGSGAYADKIMNVNPGDMVTIVVGTGGSAEVGSGGSASPGTASSVVIGTNNLISGGGPGSSAALTTVDGGTFSGADFGIQGSYGQRSIANDTRGGTAPRGGCGGVPCALGAGFEHGKAPGGAGCGGISSQNTGGNGARGVVIIHY